MPQGSILGPLLLLVFIDIVKDINSSITLFADDTSLYFNNSRIKGEDLVPVKCI